ncbi:phosphatase 2C-like domain-containing protein [Mycotypha africana]|uniref:phosphatase 2C-like domain-containing protein n=1 Tax=Mycotypha africana TaxID=64632 RepID=UPI0022FFF09B|nr:phosphatase 2C-like domain-containing protein [Mycotypha africana]KAI8977310.1 phosphatase 2C-like domain-containing protein [Mycotypha africana]
MGQTLSAPVVDKLTHQGKDSHFIYGVSAMQGWRISMEDAHCTELDVDGTNASFFGVYDGHGGSTIAQYTGENLHHRVINNPYFAKKEYEKALTAAFKELDKELLEDPNFAYDPSGCTAVTALVTPDRKTIYVANAGDSRAIISISGKHKALSYDHKPSDAKESQRITNAGGFVEFGRVNGNLALSRAIGDFEFKQNSSLSPEEQAVTCKPDVIQHNITADDEFFVLACDGIWDCMSNQEVVQYIREKLAQKMRLEDICEEIMEDCLAPESDASNVGCDNMSIMIIGILNGKTEEEWYDWMAQRATPKKDALGNDISNSDAESVGNDDNVEENNNGSEDANKVSASATEPIAVPAEDIIEKVPLNNMNIDTSTAKNGETDHKAK